MDVPESVRVFSARYCKGEIKNLTFKTCTNKNKKEGTETSFYYKTVSERGL